MTGRPMLGIMLALVVEGAHWTRFRWDFNEDACDRAWQLSSTAIAIAGVLIYLDGPARLTLSILLTWMPPLLLPVQFIQSFGLKDSMPLNTFSFLAKQRRRRNVRLGLPHSILHINFGNIYFVTALIGSTLGNQSSGPYSWLFLPGIIVLTGWILLSASRSRPTSLVIALIIAGVIAIAGQKGLEELDERLGNRGAAPSGFDPNSVSTAVGKRLRVELSQDIVWRLTPLQGKPPSLLRTASYNTYREDGRWVCKPTFFDPEFTDLATRLSGDTPYYILTRENSSEAEQIASVGPDLPRFTLRGSSSEYSPLSLPGNTASLRDFDLDAVDRNYFGTVRLFPKHSVIEGTVLWKDDSLTENPVFLEEDLKVPFLEHRALKSVLKELHLLRPTLRETYNRKDRFTVPLKFDFKDPTPLPETFRRDDTMSLRQKLGIIRSWFHREFRYSRDLTIRTSPNLPATPTAIEQFLTETRAGHCEYFASAAVLLLREAGIPARYATGYAVMERDARRNEYVIRGAHGHAWCRVWDADAGRWIDFDTTPGNWFGNIAPQNRECNASTT